ncbi:MAG: thioesterase family protein, partial [Myxococcales bacterium]|nr:thioesterase family protein [Myxococcales bacterium]
RESAMIDPPDKDSPLGAIRKVFEELIPFNKYLGLKVDEMAAGHCVMSVDFREDFVGDIGKGMVHGGVISTLIDTAGGATAFTVLDFDREHSLNTVDMRVDYMRPGQGKRFIATGSVTRRGSRLCVTQVDVHNDEGMHIARGTAVYSVMKRPK